MLVDDESLDEEELVLDDEPELELSELDDELELSELDDSELLEPPEEDEPRLSFL